MKYDIAAMKNYVPLAVQGLVAVAASDVLQQKSDANNALLALANDILTDAAESTGVRKG